MPVPCQLTMQKTFKREISSLEGIFAFIQDFFARECIASRHLYSVSLAAEELFTNMVKYNPGNANDILIDVSTAGDQLRLTLTDLDVDSFDVTQARPAPRGVPLQDLRGGGFGLCLVQQMVDGMAYDYEGRRSTVTVTKKLR